jgi:hypothetical protein
MKRLAVLSLLFAVAVALPAAADHPSGATRGDLRQLQREMDLLDDTMRQVQADHPQAREFRRREQELRDDLVRMREQVMRHQQDGDAYGPSRTELDALRRDAVALRQDIERSLDTRSRGLASDVTLPDGTEIPIRLDQSLSSRSARVEDRVEASVGRSVMQDGVVVLPVGTRVLGTVRAVEKAERPSKGGHLELSFDSVVLDDGRRVDVDARVMSLEEEGLDKSKAGLGALIGGILGAVVDGGKGAVIGGILGGGGTIAASRGEDVELPAGTLLTVQLERPMRVGRR